MGTKTLGIMGKGRAIHNFFTCLRDDSLEGLFDYKKSDSKNGKDSEREIERDNLAHYIAPSRKIFFDMVEKVVFYNYGYTTDDDFKRGWLTELEENLSSVHFEVQSDFKRFMVCSDAVVDATGGYISWRDTKKKFSLCEYAKGLAAKGKSDVKLNVKEDWNLYEQGGVGGRKLMSEEEFLREWDFSHRLIARIGEVDRHLHTHLDEGIRSESSESGYSLIGFRMYVEFPFIVSTMIERGKKLQSMAEKGMRLPTYVLLANEMCMLANVLAGNCPTMAKKIVACTGYDLYRLEKVLNEEYASLKEQAGFPQIHLAVSLKGFHDTQGTIPVIYPQREEDREMFEKIFDMMEYRKAYDFLHKETGNYYPNHISDAKNSDMQTAAYLLKTVVPALQSVGRALLVFPGYDERPLNNGYFQQRDDTGKGLFLVGDQRFRNGKVVGA